MQSLDVILKEQKIFEGLREEDHKLIAGCAFNTHFEANQYIFREGENADTFYIIRYGTVGLELRNPKGGIITVQTLREGDVLGWSWLFEPYRWTYDAHAISMVRAVALDGRCLRTKCDHDHTLGYELMRRFAHIMVERLQATRMQVLDLYA